MSDTRPVMVRSGRAAIAGDWPGRISWEQSVISRERITRVWKTVHPEALAHGHPHIKGGITMLTGQRVHSLAGKGRPETVGCSTAECLE